MGESGGSRPVIRVFVHAELDTHRPDFTPVAVSSRGAPSVCLVPVPAVADDFVQLFNGLIAAKHNHAYQECSQVDVFLHSVHGAQLGPDFYAVRADDCLLIRGKCSVADQQRVALSAEPPAVQRQVEINYKILHLSSIDTALQTFYCDFLVIAKWHEPAIEGVPRSSLDMGRAWSPRLEVENAFEPFKRLSCSRRADRSLSGVVTEVSHFKGTLSHPLELDDFPVDTQGLLIKIQPAGNHLVEMSCAPRSVTVTDRFRELRRWDVLCDDSSTVLTDEKLSTRGLSYSQVHVKIFVRRKWDMTHLCLYSMVSAMTFLSLTLPFLIPPMVSDRWFVDRLTTCLMLLLAAVGVKSQIDHHLPAVIGLTPFDRFILLDFGFILGALLEIGVLGLLAQMFAEPQKPVGQMDHAEARVYREALEWHAALPRLVASVDRVFLVASGTLWAYWHIRAMLWAHERSKIVPLPLQAIIKDRAKLATALAEAKKTK